MIDQRAALASLRINWANTPDEVWHDSPCHVDALHADAVAAVDAAVGDARASFGPSPIGLVLQGQKGVGKTHLLGLVRRRTHEQGGYFFLDDLTAGDAFWENTAESLRRGLARDSDDGTTQLSRFLSRACERGQVDPDVAARIVGGWPVTRTDLDAFVAGLRALDRQVAAECSDTARAMVLYARHSSEVAYVGECHLTGVDGVTADERTPWGIRATPKSALTRVQDITRLLALTGPVVIGVDQLDSLIAKSRRHSGDSAPAEDLLVARIADGLMRLREITRRTVTVLACLPGTWSSISAAAADTVGDRFRESLILSRVADGVVGRELVERRLSVAYQAMGFDPPHPTWPVAPEAFAGGWERQTPRELWKRLSAHIDASLREGEIGELTTFTGDDGRAVDRGHSAVDMAVEPDRFVELDEEFEKLRSAADVDLLLDPAAEDREVRDVLSAALLSWITELGGHRMEWERGSDGRDLHARLIHTVDETSDLTEQWAFRMISAPHHNAVLSRLRKARSAAGLEMGGDNHLVVIRNGDWSPGPMTAAEISAFEAAGGLRRGVSDGDLRTFWALSQIWTESAEFLAWLVDRKPASRSELLSTVLPTVVEGGEGARNAASSDSVPLGTAAGGRAVTVHLAALRQHAAVFAGSGSGKTVLLRRVVEECALHGVSAIVLDPNNDLARLGDAWPEPPDAWAPGDADLARRYLDETDVVIWTPGRTAGRPLTLRPLPDFAEVLGDADEFEVAVEIAAATLAAQLRIARTTDRANIRRAVLREAITYYATSGASGLPGLVTLLSDLPEDASTLNDGRRIGADLAEALKAAMVNDPLLAGGGDPVDPGVLLTPPQGKRARVSVISFVGLPADDQRRNFVNQLQMELFAWIKRNPAGDRPLGALYVMDEAQSLAASGSMTASTRSTIVLASQARKYGLGLLFATQAPKGLHNQVVGNAMTQFYGRLNSNVQIDAVNDLARAKGTPVADISRLERAQFYVSGEASGFHKITTPLCLTHHPAAPLRPEEVIERARRGGSG
ncbi:protein of unknown function DUF87 [Actinokineospora alba]|uniref:AAA+ ATPase domain-containing protein n=1 Tax=Actinokineospora alba TaxID=504798 RepID=A0A1H0QPS8_9PSEU|nr:DUF87 domain-containing protein [Actinokineospora alba]TDP70448.1 uncharacterized protein DUF87 [Actinokineospora alba]SDI31397.1 protein of unknown function DUF87 [Actinokineospora alba]SDP19371.1 protein of unknown function DUF87 [Actinokineospora alba]